MDRSEALSRIELIREYLARAESMSVYHSASVALTGVMALMGGAVQYAWEWNQPRPFVVLWVIVAAACAALVSVETFVRCRLREPGLMRDATIAAARQFVPCVAAGALLTFAISRSWPAAMNLLPALWSIIFGLGIFASRPGLPKGINYAAGYYLMVGALLIDQLPKSGGIPAWAMPLSFGVGQLLLAAIIHFSCEHEHEQA